MPLAMFSPPRDENSQASRSMMPPPTPEVSQPVQQTRSPWPRTRAPAIQRTRIQPPVDFSIGPPSRMIEDESPPNAALPIPLAVFSAPAGSMPPPGPASSINRRQPLSPTTGNSLRRMERPAVTVQRPTLSRTFSNGNLTGTERRRRDAMTEGTPTWEHVEERSDTETVRPVSRRGLPEEAYSTADSDLRNARRVRQQQMTPQQFQAAAFQQQVHRYAHELLEQQLPSFSQRYPNGIPQGLLTALRATSERNAAMELRDNLNLNREQLAQQHSQTFNSQRYEQHSTTLNRDANIRTTGSSNPSTVRHGFRQHLLLPPTSGSLDPFLHRRDSEETIDLQYLLPYVSGSRLNGTGEPRYRPIPNPTEAIRRIRDDPPMDGTQNYDFSQLLPPPPPPPTPPAVGHSLLFDIGSEARYATQTVRATAPVVSLEVLQGRQSPRREDDSRPVSPTPSTPDHIHPDSPSASDYVSAANSDTEAYFDAQPLPDMVLFSAQLDEIAQNENAIVEDAEMQNSYKDLSLGYSRTLIRWCENLRRRVLQGNRSVRFSISEDQFLIAQVRTSFDGSPECLSSGVSVLKQILEECKPLCAQMVQSLEELRRVEGFNLEKLEQFCNILCRADMREERQIWTDCILGQFGFHPVTIATRNWRRP